VICLKRELHPDPRPLLPTPRAPKGQGLFHVCDSALCIRSSCLLTSAPAPAWIDSYEAKFGTPPVDQLQPLNEPQRPVLPQHNCVPSEPRRRVSKDGFVDWMDEAAAAEGQRNISAGQRVQSLLRRGRGGDRGRKWDHLRSAEPVIVPSYISPGTATPWRSFVHSSEYGHIPNEEAEVVPQDMLDKLQPGFNNPVELPRLMELTKKRQRAQALYKRIWAVVLRHPLVPLFLRLTVLLTSMIALALAARIYEIEHGGTRHDHIAEAIVAIVVDTTAIPYIGYMTWDEYTGRPLGLRSPTSKIALILMDLFFIIFKSISTTLAFETLARSNTLENGTELRFSEALAAFQIVSLISWTMTFTVNVFRLVQRLGGGEEDALQ
jgi:hypothetical protein